MVSQLNLFLIDKVSGFDYQVGHLVSMLNYVRHGTITAVQNLTVDELDYLPDEESNSIGALLLHIAAAEVGYKAATFQNRHLTADEKDQWKAVITLGETARQEVRGFEITYYLNKLAHVRSITLTELALRDEKWLFEQTIFAEKNKINNYFKWFHVLTHEVNHRGQMRTLLRQSKKTLGK